MPVAPKVVAPVPDTSGAALSNGINAPLTTNVPATDIFTLSVTVLPPLMVSFLKGVALLPLIVWLVPVNVTLELELVPL